MHLLKIHILVKSNALAQNSRKCNSKLEGVCLRVPLKHQVKKQKQKKVTSVFFPFFLEAHTLQSNHTFIQSSRHLY